MNSNTLQLHIILKEALKQPIAYHRIFSKIMRSISGGVILSQLYYWSDRMQHQKFYKTDEEILEETTASCWELKVAKKKLKNIGLFSITRECLPSKTFYEINHEKLIELFERVINSSLAESAKLDRRNPPNYTGGIRQTINTENTTENTNREIDSYEYSVSNDEKTTTQQTTETDCKNLSNFSKFKNTNETQQDNNETNLSKLTAICKDLEKDEFQLAQLANRATGKNLKTEVLHQTLDSMIDYYSQNPGYLKNSGLNTIRRWFAKSNELSKFEDPVTRIQEAVAELSSAQVMDVELKELRSKLVAIERSIEKGEQAGSSTLVSTLKENKQKIQNRIDFLSGKSHGKTVEQHVANKMFDIS